MTVSLIGDGLGVADEAGVSFKEVRGGLIDPVIDGSDSEPSALARASSVA